MKFNSDPVSVEAAAAKIKLLLLDVDGVLTDGRLFFSSSGEEIKAFHSLDGHGIKMLQRAGIDVGIITGRQSVLVEKRAADLGIEILYQGREDKLDVLTEISEHREIAMEHICYVGDDFPDLPVLTAVGLSFSVPQGHSDIKSSVDAITSTSGGMGAVREITDYLLKAQNKYYEILES
jgi:3-deoxy-D-manno-octulosonate 8-phosphate phosphatase (KDO 8-P phosphatase)